MQVTTGTKPGRAAAALVAAAAAAQLSAPDVDALAAAGARAAPHRRYWFSHLPAK